MCHVIKCGDGTPFPPRVLKIKLRIGYCSNHMGGPTSQEGALLFPVIEHGVGDEALITPRILKQ